MIRAATPADLDAVFAIKEATVEIFKTEGNPQWDADYPTRRSFLADIAEGSLYVLEQGGKIAGFACINQTQPPEYRALKWGGGAPLFLHRVAVDPALRKSGVAGRLMAFAEQLARERGAATIQTDTCSRNAAMQRLFRRLGYRRLDGAIELRDLGVDFYCFEKRLDEPAPCITPLLPEQLEPAMALVLRVFGEFEAPEYSAEGIREFENYVAPAAIGPRIQSGELLAWVCSVGGRLVGVAALDPKRAHISLLFVEGREHNRGYGKALFYAMRDYAANSLGARALTVNSSPFAVKIYERLGFVAAGSEREANGIRFTPMRCDF